MIETLKELDRMLFLMINNHWQNGLFDLLCPFMRNAKNWIPLYGIFVYLMFSKFEKKTWWLLLTCGITILISDQLSGNLIKHAVERLRPCNEPSLVGQIHLLVNCGSGYSFVSSHACNHFAIAVLLSFMFGRFYRWFTPTIYGWAALISFSQIYVGVHYPIDVIVGALLGIAIGNIAVWLIQKKVSFHPIEPQP